jgi:hypothetical protein
VRKKLLASLSLALLVSLLSTVVVWADEPSPDWSDPATVRNLVEQLATAGDNGAELWEQLPPEAQAAVLEYATVERFETLVTTGQLDGECKMVQVERRAFSPVGLHLFSYFQRIDFCYDREAITSCTRSRWGEIYNGPWEFVGHVADVEQGGVGYNLYRSWTKGHFQMVIGGEPVQHVYPWIDMTVYGDGSWKHSSGGT